MDCKYTSCRGHFRLFHKFLSGWDKKCNLCSFDKWGLNDVYVIHMLCLTLYVLIAFVSTTLHGHFRLSHKYRFVWDKKSNFWPINDVYVIKMFSALFVLIVFICFSWQGHFLYFAQILLLMGQKCYFFPIDKWGLIFVHVNFVEMWFFHFVNLHFLPCKYKKN